jgi:hypothetical protein
VPEVEGERVGEREGDEGDGRERTWGSALFVMRWWSDPTLIWTTRGFFTSSHPKTNDWRMSSECRMAATSPTLEKNREERV